MEINPWKILRSALTYGTLTIGAIASIGLVSQVMEQKLFAVQNLEPILLVCPIAIGALGFLIVPKLLSLRKK